ncbi:S1 family peptidase [Umezawaea tangerina]|uniref:Trypsin-like peptidase n=1 Tax=Umezawaea tangerina TaxID=84725 RepID=A0A2T0TGX1_9PSEU|nr:serine protease [Umezawaea tangerina]PRY44861.1 trypsin-like peptidase [Umezawaea tangerina]
MIVGRGRSGPFAYGDEPWRVRVRDRSPHGPVLGAGVLLDRLHVLTCAHVALAAEELAVDLVGLDGVPSSDAAVVDGMCVPPGEDERGDVAVLRLATPQRAGLGATLRRAMPTWDRPVHALGYPQGRGLEIGVWARMTLAGRAGVEWWQMNRRSEGEQRVRAGFSGSGVADDATGEVLGIVVSEYTDDTAGLSWMLPVDAITAHLPFASEWAVGDSGIDPIFTAPAGHGDGNGPTRELVDWLLGRDAAAAVLILVGPDLDVVRRAVAESTRRTATEAGVRGVDLALDVAGRTVDEVSRRIVDRAGLAVGASSTPGERVREGTPPMTIVVDGVDEADEPEALVDDVLKPLVDSGARLVLGFRQDGSAGLAAAKSLADDTIAGRLDRLADRITAVARREGPRPLGSSDTHSTVLRLRLTALRKAAAAHSALVANRLTAFERAVASAEREVGRTARRSAAVAADRGLLEAWKAKAFDAGLVEDIGLAAAYRRAHGLLTAETVDQAAAHAALRAYQDAVREALAKGDRR